MDNIFTSTIVFNQSLCRWGQRQLMKRLSVIGMFNNSNCPTEQDPNL